jgi:predicted Zn finger-like uncharacterized protein
MALESSCPGCGTKVRIPESLLGKRVKCPKCNMVFTAEKPEAGFEEVHDDEEKPPVNQRSAGANEDGDDDDDHGERRPRRRFRQPHRGTTVLVLGILSLVMCAPLGIAAWIMGNNDLAAMRRGSMDRSGEGTTQAGRICGMIASILMFAVCALYALVIVFAIVAGGARGH